MVLLSLAMVAHGGYVIFEGECLFENNRGLSCLIPTFEQLAAILGWGLFLSAMVYLGSSVYERKLADRQIHWKYFRANFGRRKRLPYRLDFGQTTP